MWPRRNRPPSPGLMATALPWCFCLETTPSPRAGQGGGGSVVRKRKEEEKTNGAVSSLGSILRACHCHWRTSRWRQRGGLLEGGTAAARSIFSLQLDKRDESFKGGDQGQHQPLKGQSGPQSRNIPFLTLFHSPLVRPRVVYQSKQRGPELPPIGCQEGPCPVTSQ